MIADRATSYTLGGTVDHGPVVAVGDGRELLVDRRLGQADDREPRLPLAGRGPIEGAALRVGIDEQDTVVPSGERVGDVDGERRLPDPALLIQE